MKVFIGRTLLFVGIVAGVGVAFIPAYYFYSQYQKSQRLLHHPEEAAKEEIQQIISQVGKLVLVPDGEQPTLATVSDKEKLQDQPFFSQAENGDRVLVYTNAKKAILYRPSINRVIGMAPLNPGDAAGTATDSGQLQRYTAAIYNGSSTPGVAGKLEKVLTRKWGQVGVVQKKNAAKTTYEKTLVVPVREHAAPMAQEMAEFLDGSVSTIPAAEVPPDADILIIIGASLPQ